MQLYIVNELLNKETNPKKSEKTGDHPKVPEIVSDPDHTEDMKMKIASDSDTKDMKMKVVGDLDYTKDLKIEVDSDSDHTKEGDPDPSEESTYNKLIKELKKVEDFVQELKKLKKLPEEILMSILKK
ncbi:unnamed protein product [Rhizophagus irregularis]|nr:unnamed protein product [Rhizophagus irregularis]